jgi:GT2 family glycosyltransferase
VNELKADIFIPTSNRLDALAACLQSLELQSNINFRLIIGALKEDFKIRTLVKQFSHLDIIYFIQKSPGLIGAANEALLLASNEIFIRIDDDTVLSPAWYEEILSVFANDKNVGGVTGPTIMSAEGLAARDLTSFLEKFKSGKSPLYSLLYWIYADFLYQGKMLKPSLLLDSGVFTLGSNYPTSRNGDSPFVVGNLEACNWSCRTILLKSNGGFDEVYVRGLGDYHEADAALKIMHSGYKLVFNPAAWLQHNVEIGYVAKARPAPYWRIQNFIIFYFRYFPIKTLGQFLRFTTNLMLQNSYYLFRFLTTFKLNQLGALAGTAVGLFRVLFKFRN